MDLEQFSREIDADVQLLAAASGDYEQATFTEWALAQLVDAGEITDWNASYLDAVGKARRRMRIDAFAYDEIDDQLTVVVADFEPFAEQMLTKSEIEALLGAALAFVQTAVSDDAFDKIPITEDAAVAAESLQRRFGPASRLRILLVTNRKISGRIRALPSAEFDGKEVTFGAWDIQRFFDLRLSETGREESIVEFSEWNDQGFPILEASTTDSSLSVYVLTLPGRVLAEIFQKYGSRLLEGNVRSFLSIRGKVNKGIRMTLLNEPERFLAYNNGITATAVRAEVAQQNGSKFLRSVTDLQIVNGGQTTASLYNFLRHEKDAIQSLSAVYVQIKLIVVEPSDADEIVPLISRFANSQNAVNETDFFSNSPFHRRIEEMSKRISAPPATGKHLESKWFYERARGSYLNERGRETTAAKQNAFDEKFPKTQLITKTDLARYFNVWAQKPHEVSKGAQKNFMTFAEPISKDFLTEAGRAKYGDDFYKEMVVVAIVYKSLHKAIQKVDWYETGYLANIVAYTVSRLSFELATKSLTLDWSKIWKAQAISAEMESQLLAIARQMLGVLTDSNRKHQNVTEWAKTEACWTAAQSCKLSLTRDFLSQLVPVGGELERERKVVARDRGKILGETEKIQKLLAVSESGWEGALALPSSLVGPIVENYVRIFRKNPVGLTVKQLDQVLGLIDRAKLEGVKID